MMTKINKNNFRAMTPKKSLALSDLGPWAWNKISGLGIGPRKVEGSRNKNPPHILLYLIIMYPKDVSLTFSTPSLPAAPTMTNANLPLHNLLLYQTLPSYWRLIIIILPEILWLMTQRPETLWCLKENIRTVGPEISSDIL